MTTTLARPRLDPLLDAPLVGPRLLSLVGDWAVVCNLWRVWQPAAFLSLHGYPVTWRWLRDPENARLFGAVEAITFCRASWLPEAQAGGAGLLERLRRSGRKVFYECDDDFFTPFGEQHQRERLPQPAGPPLASEAQLRVESAAARWMLQHVDGVTVSTQYLASVVRRFTDVPVEVVPNAIDAPWFQRRQQGIPRPVDGLTIGWAGGNRPEADFAEMALAWGAVARRHPEVTFLVVGHQSPLLLQHVPADRLVSLPWRPPEDYPAALVGMDIACCPLADRPFNRAKTPIKAWEYGLSGAAVVASPTVYDKVITDGHSGLLASTREEWEEALELLVERPEAREALAAVLRREVLTRWSLKQHYWRWPLAWNRLWQGD